MEFRLPDVGEGIHEAEIVRWLVREGDVVALDQPLAEVQTDKALVEIPSPQAGRIARLRAKEGDVVPVGQVLVEYEAPDPDRVTVERAAANEAGSGDVTGLAPQPAPASAPLGAQPSPPGRILATPATRRLARELGVPLERVRGTGPAGRVTAEDVRAYAVAASQLQGAQGAQAAPSAREIPAAADQATPGASMTSSSAAVGPSAAATAKVPPVSTAPDTTSVVAAPQVVPLRGLRRRTAERLTWAAHHIPQVTHMDEVDVSELVALREHLKARAAERQVKLTYLPFIIRAVAAALRQYPQFNAHLDEAGEQLTIHPELHLGLATATKDGLLVPVIPSAQAKGILTLAREIQALTEGAHARTLQPAQLRGSTFTISNVGPLGGLFATPLVNPPEVAILAVHRIKEQPAVYRGAIVPRHILTFSLSFDHRVIDGADAVNFTNAMAALLADPTALLLE